MEKKCNSIGVETWVCLWRGKGNLCEKPENRIPYDYGTCPHQIYNKRDEKVKVSEGEGLGNL